MTAPCTGIILAGGRNSRFHGQPKGLLSVGGSRILDRIHTVFTGLFDEIILVTNDPLRYLEWNVAIVSDILPVRSSMTGIHAGLFHAKYPHVFVSACDTPFLETELIRAILRWIAPGIDVIIPRTRLGYEPLCAVYGKRCQAVMERQMEKGALKIQGFLNKVRVREIPETEIRRYDPEQASFFNINTPEDLVCAQAGLKGGR